jgi:hypothetical protein
MEFDFQGRTSGYKRYMHPLTTPSVTISVTYLCIATPNTNVQIAERASPRAKGIAIYVGDPLHTYRIDTMSSGKDNGNATEPDRKVKTIEVTLTD